MKFRLSLPRRLGVTVFAACVSAASLVARGQVPVPDKIDFNRDMRPILSDNCFACHGPDKNKRKADLRLDTREGITADLEDRHVTVVPATRSRASCSGG